MSEIGKMKRVERGVRKALRPYMGTSKDDNFTEIILAIRTVADIYRTKPGQPNFSIIPNFSDDGRLEGVEIGVRLIW